MFSSFRNRFGIPGVISVVALVFAMIGGAYAASNGGSDNGATASAKKATKGPRGPKGAKGATGATGPAGPAGAAGPQGAKGDIGAAGKDGATGATGNTGLTGSKGANGETVNVVTLAPGADENCKTGGAKLFNNTGTAYACNGEEGGGGGGYPKTLPAGHSMAGYWEVLGDAAFHVDIGLGNSAVSMLSFPLPLAVAPTETVLIKPGATEAEKDKCPGNADNPQATAGVLCLYKAFGEMTLQFGVPSAFGATLLFGATDEGIGSWAVSAP